MPIGLTRWRGKLAGCSLLLYPVQLGVGAFNVLLLAPIWLQLWHLLISDALWIMLVLFAATALAQPATQANQVDLLKPSPQVKRTA